MKIRLSDCGKRYNREWIFRHANLEFETGKSYAITGPNGSGKSTLLQTIGGLLQASEGSVAFLKKDQPLSPEIFFRNISFCAPYLDVIEEMTLLEFLHFHSGFKPFINGIDAPKIIRTLNLEAAAHKQIRNYSSGMKQRIKLAQAVFSDSAVLLLDEPCSNLDVHGIEIYHSLIRDFGKDRLIIVSSNDEVEYRFCQKVISIQDYK